MEHDAAAPVDRELLGAAEAARDLVQALRIRPRERREESDAAAERRVRADAVRRDHQRDDAGRQREDDRRQDKNAEEELADAKAYLTGSYPLGFDSNAKIASQMMGVRQDELGIDYFDLRNDKVRAVTLEDVNRVAKEYLNPEDYLFVAVGQPEGISVEEFESEDPAEMESESED